MFFLTPSIIGSKNDRIYFDQLAGSSDGDNQSNHFGLSDEELAIVYKG